MTRDPRPQMASRAVAHGRTEDSRQRRRVAVGLAVGAVVFAVLEGSGELSSIAVTLGLMGFDVDRTSLISGLLGASIAAGCAGLFSTELLPAVVIGIAGTVLSFGPTFLRETQAAMGSRAAFDPVGWLVSLVAVTVVAGLAGWAAGTVGVELHRELSEVGVSLRAAWRGSQRRWEAWLRPAIAVVLVLGLVMSLPVFAQMVNYSPDALMWRGLALDAPLVGSVSSSSPSPGTEPTPTPPSTAGMVAGPLPGSLISADTVSALRPWVGRAPVGTGRLESRVFPGPWVDGIRATADVDVYLPASYSTSNLRYPTVYFLPWNFATWDDAMHMGTVLDGLISSGRIPPSVYVFISQAGAHYTETECADSFDGKQWMERYITQTVVPWVDATYRTLVTPAARSLFGYSEGAFCSSMLLVRHPELFGAAVALSGYYHAGPRTSETPTAWRVFGGIPSTIAAYSPAEIIPHLPATQRDRLFLIIGADPGEAFFGAEYVSLAGVLAQLDMPHALIPSTSSGHSFRAVRDVMGVVLELLAARQVFLGVVN